jgi:type I restriction enzyme S subunit
MRNVPLMSLADIAESVQYGYTASASDSEVGPKFLRITDIVPPQIDWANVPYCEIDEKNLAKFSLESEVYKRFVLSRVGGAAQPNANAKVLSSFRLPIPGKAIQHRIASILSAYDDLIENNRLRIQLLEQAARLACRRGGRRRRSPTCVKLSVGALLLPKYRSIGKATSHGLSLRISPRTTV